MGEVVSVTPRPLYPQDDPVLMFRRVDGPQGPVWTGAKNLATTGI